MSGTQDQPPDPALDREARLNAKIDTILSLANTVAGGYSSLNKMHEEQRESIKKISEQFMPIVLQLKSTQEEILSEQNKLRGFLLGKIDGLQGTMDLLRQDVRNSWQTADFAISNSRNMRDEVEQLQTLISTMQKQYQLLASQVEVLRRSADEKE